MRLIDADAFEKSMYHEAFETDSDMQRWDSGCWIRYKMFENAIENFPTADAVLLDKIINVSLFDEEHEEWSNKEMTVREYLYMYTDFEVDG